MVSRKRTPLGRRQTKKLPQQVQVCEPLLGRRPRTFSIQEPRGPSRHGRRRTICRPKTDAKPALDPQDEQSNATRVHGQRTTKVGPQRAERNTIGWMARQEPRSCAICTTLPLGTLRIKRGMFRVIWWKNGERYVDNFHWALFDNALRWAEYKLRMEDADDAMVEQTSNNPDWIQRKDEWVDARSGQNAESDKYYVDWEREEKKARIRYKQDQKIKQGGSIGFYRFAPGRLTVSLRSRAAGKMRHPLNPTLS